MTRSQFNALKAQKTAPVQSSPKMTRSQFTAMGGQPVKTMTRSEFNAVKGNPVWNAVKGAGKEMVGTTAAVGADLLNVLQPWKNEKIENVNLFGKDFITPSARGAKAGELIRQGQYKKAAGELGTAGLDIVSTFATPAKGLKILKGAGALKGAAQGALIGSQIGAGYGLAGSAREGKGAREIASSTLLGAGTGAVGGGILGGGAGLLGKAFKGKVKEPIIDVEAESFVKGESTKPQVITPLQEGGKQRGFAGTVKGSKNTDARLKMLVDSNYVPQPNDELMVHATDLIKRDINQAKVKALKGDDNLAVATATELIKHYQNKGDFDAAAEITKTVAEKLTEHGRAIQAASLYNKLTPEGIKIFAQKELSKEGLTLKPEQADELQKMAEMAQKAAGEDKAIKTGQMLNRLQEMVPSKFIDQLTTVWKAGLLTNPTTHIANLTGNTAMSGMEMAKDIPATVFDKVASLFTGQRTKTTPNLLSFLRGAGTGARKAWVFMKTGVDVDQTLGKYDFKQVNLPPVLKQYAQTIFRALGAGDKVFKEGLLQKSLKELSIVEGLNKGLKGKELANFSKNLYQNPTVEMMKIATEDALYGTFNNPNKFAEMIAKGKSSDNQVVRGFLELVAPFSRTPTNVAGRIIDYSPAGFLKAIGQGVSGGGQRNVVESLGRATIGTGIMGAGYGLGKAGLMTGNYPTNPTEQNLWELTGKQPGSIKIGDKWYSMNRISPAGNLLSTGSGMADLGRMKPQDVPLAMAGVAGKNLLGQTYLQGVSGMLNALQDPKRYGENWTNSLASSVIPSIVGTTAKAIDPTMRQTNSIQDAIQAKIPGMSQNLLPKVDVFGQERQQGNTGLGRFINPFNPSQAKDTPLTNELDRLYANYSGFSLGDPSKSVSIQGTGIKVEMTPEEYTMMQKQTGGMIGNVLNKVVSAPGYQKLSDYDRAKILNDTISKLRQVWNVNSIPYLKNTRSQVQEQLKKQMELRNLQPFYGN